MIALTPVATSKTKARKLAAARPLVFAVSDSTGNLVRHMLTAFLTQFPPAALSVRFESFVRTDERLDEVLAAARKARAVVCHAMVSPAFKARVAAFCGAAGVPCCDRRGR